LIFSTSDNDYSVRPIQISSLNINNEENSEIIIENYKSCLLNEDMSGSTWTLLLKYFNICINNDLPFSTFDILKALVCSSEIAAKSFLYFACFDEQEKFVIEQYKQVEDDLGFSFHWISRDDWTKAITWIGNQDNELINHIINAVT
jgi:hypothetical protein